MDDICKQCLQEECECECECCFYKTIHIEERITVEFKDGRGTEVKRLLCDICYETGLNKTLKSPCYLELPDLARAIGWIGNKILERLEETKGDRL